MGAGVIMVTGKRLNVCKYYAVGILEAQENHWDQIGAGVIMATGKRVNVYK